VTVLFDSDRFGVSCLSGCAGFSAGERAVHLASPGLIRKTRILEGRLANQLPANRRSIGLAAALGTQRAQGKLTEF